MLKNRIPENYKNLVIDTSFTKKYIKNLFLRIKWRNHLRNKS